MTPLRRVLVRLAEQLLGRWREGPEPPARLREEVDLFAAGMTAGELRFLAKKLVDKAYREGFARGFEHAERDPRGRRFGDPDAVADQVDPGWRERSPEVDLGPVDLVVDPRDATLPARRS